MFVNISKELFQFDHTQTKLLTLFGRNEANLTLVFGIFANMFKFAKPAHR